MPSHFSDTEVPDEDNADMFDICKDSGLFHCLLISARLDQGSHASLFMQVCSLKLQ